MRRTLLLFLFLCAAGTAGAQITLTKGTNFSVGAAADGRLTIDLLGKIWVLPADGGTARAITDSTISARRPRWSPDAGAIVFQARADNQEQLWLHRLEDDTTQNISDGQYFDLQPSWHPDGERIVYASDRRDTGFDLWELDVATGLTWRISHLAGDETEPAWSADGRDLVYVHRLDDRWSLLLRRRGQPDRVLVSSDTPIMAPSWRPDGSLITFLRQNPAGLTIEMVILSEPLLVRPLITGEDFFLSPVAWTDRQQMLYAADGLIRKRLFNSWSSSTVPFRATVQRGKPPDRQALPRRELPIIDPPTGQLVLRAARLFDGIGGGYREDLDIVIDGSRITAVEPRQDRAGAIIVDMGDLTALPGLIDASASLPADVEATLGPVLLAFGVTTVVTDYERADELNALWSGKALPGPRVLGGDWQPGLESLATALPGVGSLPTSPRGIRYEDARIGGGSAAVPVLSGLADSRTRALRSLLGLRQARFLKSYPTAIRRFIEKPQLSAQASTIVAGSAANGFPPGIALHAELLALTEAGLDEEYALRSAGIHAAAALGLGLQLGRIAPGSAADLVLVDGDPLASIADLQKIVGIVRNGRFFSAIGLLERASQQVAVE